MDATSLGNRWTILAGSWVMSGCAIPVARTRDPSRTARVLASVVGRTAGRGRQSGVGRVGSDRAGRAGLVRSLTVGRHCGVGLASVLTPQCGMQSTLARRGKL